MEKESKKVWIGIIVIALIAGAYYFGTTSKDSTGQIDKAQNTTTSAINQEQTPANQALGKASSDEKRQCASDGAIFFAQFKNQQLKSAQELHETETVDDPQYHYNTSMQTCLISLSYTMFGYAGANDDIFVNQIRDVYSNKIIITGTWSLNGTFQVNLKQPEYTQQSKVLMTQ